MLVRAKKEYVCDSTGGKIVVGEAYLKMTIGGAGVMRFKTSTTERERADAIHARLLRVMK